MTCQGAREAEGGRRNRRKEGGIGQGRGRRREMGRTLCIGVEQAFVSVSYGTKLYVNMWQVS